MFQKLKDAVACIDLRETDFCSVIQIAITGILNEGRSVFFFVTPEKLKHLHQFHNFVQGRKEEKTIIYDEAHCIPTWGVEFRPSLLSSLR